MEHPDITSAQRTGYATFQSAENQDCPENRAEYIDAHLSEVISWVRHNYPELVDQYIEEHKRDYTAWLN